MKKISNFYTLFWVVYFPTCLAFQNYIGMDWVDELLCIALMLFGMLQWKNRYVNRKMEKEMGQYWMIMGFYFLYSLIISVTTFRGIYLDFLQQIRPYMVFYMTLFLAPQFSQNQKKMIVGSMLVTMVVFMLMSNAVGLYRLGLEQGDLPMVALTTGMTYLLFTERSRQNSFIAIAIMLVGLMSGKSKYIGQCVVFIYIVMFMKGRINFKSAKTYISLSLLVIAVLYFTWTKFDAYYVSGMKVEVVEKMAARPATYKTGAKILWDYFPFGSGLGSFGTAAAAKEYSPIYHEYHLDHIWGLSKDWPAFLADCFYPTLAEYGVVGILLFCVFWKRRIREMNRIEDDSNYKMAVMAFLALAVDSTANTAYLSGCGMGLFMTLAICLNSNRMQNNEIDDSDEFEDDGEELENEELVVPNV